MRCVGASLIGPPLSRVLGNFHLRMDWPQTPTRLFSSEAEAISWLGPWFEPTPEGHGRGRA